MPRMTIPNNANALGDVLMQLVDAVIKDPRKVAQCKTVSNAANARIRICANQMKYALVKGQEPDIPFLGKTSGRPLKKSAKFT